MQYARVQSFFELISTFEKPPWLILTTAVFHFTPLIFSSFSQMSDTIRTLLVGTDTDGRRMNPL